MSLSLPQNISSKALSELLIAMADDELVLGHRDSEWTGHSPILEEDIAFSNLAQDEIGHALVWLSINEELGGKNPDWMGFERPWNEFTSCRFVQYPKGDYAYTVVRQFLFDAAEKVRLTSLRSSTFQPLREAAEKILREEHYHLLHSQGMVERLGNATEESHTRMQAAVEIAFPQSLGVFELLFSEQELVSGGAMTANSTLQQQWLTLIGPVLERSSLKIPVAFSNATYSVSCKADVGGRVHNHTSHLASLVKDLQSVYQLAPDSKW